MSRSYGMHVKVIGFDPKRQSEILVAANEEWSFAEWSDNKASISVGSLPFLNFYGENFSHIFFARSWVYFFNFLQFTNTI